MTQQVMTPDDLIRQLKSVTVDQLKHAIIDAIGVHEPIHALDYGAPVRRQMTEVCTGCGQDDGNWQYWPCPTIRAIREAIT